MVIDTYTKIIFTAITIALWGLLLQPIIMPKNVGAASGIMDVNIKKLSGRNVGDSLNINLLKVNNNTLFNNYLPVSVVNK